MWLKIWLALIVYWVILLGTRIFTIKEKGGIKIWSWSGLLFAALTIIIALPILLSIFVLSRTPVYRSSIDNNLKQWGLILKMYSNESPGELFPPLTQQDGLWVPDLHVLYPEYLTDTLIVRDPDSLTEAEIRTYYQDSQEEIIDFEKTTALMAQTYVYPGWIVHDGSDVELMKHYHKEKEVHIGSFESEDMSLLWMSDEYAFTADTDALRAKVLAQAKIPVMIARPRSNKYYTVVPVLFMDGHVEKIPLTEAPDHIKALIELFPEPDQE